MNLSSGYRSSSTIFILLYCFKKAMLETMTFFFFKDGIVSNISFKIAAVQQFESVLFKMKQPEQMVVAIPT